MSRDFTTTDNSIRRLGAASRAARSRRDGDSSSSAVQAAFASFAFAPSVFALSLLATIVLATTAPLGTVSAQEQNSKKSGTNRADAKKPEANKQNSTKSDANKTDASKQEASKTAESKQAAKEAAKETTGKSGPKAKAAAKVDAAKAGAAVGVTPEREAAVMKFVEQHHPELGTLLVRLKDGDRKEYDRAVRDLFRVSERLAQTHERDQSRYELELRAWQVQSRIDLLTARMRMSGGEELKSQLRQTLLEQHQIKQQLLQFERDRVAERLQKLDEQLKGIEQSREDIVEKQLRLLSGEKKK